MAISIKTRITDKDLTGKSHWWGAPDLPSDIPYPYVNIDENDETYPEPLTFVCQIKCSDIAIYDSENLLPHTGFLYFFAPIDYFLGEYYSPLDYHTDPVIIYSSQENNLKPYKLCWEDTDESIFRPAEEIVFKKSTTLKGQDIRMLTLPYQDEISDQYIDCMAVLQLDEEDKWGLRFFDCGMYYFLMKRKDIINREWNKVKGALFTY